ncbi:MAG: DNA-binding protein [Ruminococcaceae bacterium]|nr:DNA-binding protein [Oscillospiraceae bacterium]
MFEKNLSLSRLIGFYGELLSERQKEICTLYYDDDLSLAEVAEIVGISRQGVRDALKKSEANLREIDDKLHLPDVFDERNRLLADIVRRLDTVKSAVHDKSALDTLEEALSDARKLLSKEVL